MKKKISLLIRDEGGAITVMTIIMMVAFLGILAVVIDLGHLHTVQSELRNAADAAALAGARRLMPMTGDGEPPWPMVNPPPCGDAKQAAADTAILNRVDLNKNITLDPAEVLTGVWDFIPVAGRAGTFTIAACDSTTNAVQVTARMRGDLSQGSVIMTLAKIFGGDPEVNPSVTAIAAIGNIGTIKKGGYIAPNVNFIETIYNGTYDKDGKWIGPYLKDKYWYLVFQPAQGTSSWENADNVGYGLEGGNPNPSTVIPIIEGAAIDMSIGETINLSNGLATPILKAIADAIAAAGPPGLEITVPVVNSVSFNQSEQVLNFYTLLLTDVWTAGANKKHPFPEDFLNGTGGIQQQDKFVGVIQFQILPNEANNGDPGPLNNNTMALSPKIVQ